MTSVARFYSLTPSDPSSVSLCLSLYLSFLLTHRDVHLCMHQIQPVMGSSFEEAVYKVTGMILALLHVPGTEM